MSVHTATLSVTRGDKVGKSVPLKGVFVNYPGKSNVPYNFEDIFDNGPHLSAATKGLKTQFCWTAGTGAEGRYHSPWVWEEKECPARTLFVEIDGTCMRFIFDNHGKLAAHFPGTRTLELAPTRGSKLLSSRIEGQVVGQSVLLMRGVHALTPTQVRERITALETEVGTSSTPSAVMGKLPISEPWSSRVESWGADETRPHISVMTDH